MRRGEWEKRREPSTTVNAVAVGQILQGAAGQDFSGRAAEKRADLRSAWAAVVRVLRSVSVRVRSACVGGSGGL